MKRSIHMNFASVSSSASDPRRVSVSVACEPWETPDPEKVPEPVEAAPRMSSPRHIGKYPVGGKRG